MYQGYSKGQRDKAARIVDKALAQGLTLSVSDGAGGWEVKVSRDRGDILAAIGEMDMDTIRFRDDAGSYIGTVFLVWGNADDGSELAADYTDNEAMQELAAA